MALAFRVRLKTDSDGSLLVTCPALPEVTTFGEDRADAMRRGRNAVEEALAARMYAGENIPIGDTHGAYLVRLPALIAFRVEMYRRKLRILRERTR
jgi:antitoxin HicB